MVTKDYSRLGRNRLIPGQLLGEDFVRLGVRYIAIMENIDTAKGVSDIVSIQDLDKARKITRLTELTPEILHEFIEKIVVHSPETVDSKRHQKVDIYYNAIGLWCAPDPEEMEELFQTYWAKKQRKTA